MTSMLPLPTAPKRNDRRLSLLAVATSSALFASSLIFIGPSATAAAVTPQETTAPLERSSTELFDANAEVGDFVERADPFVKFANGTFILDEESASEALTDVDISRAKALIAGTNAKLAELSPSSAVSVQVVTPGARSEANAITAAYREGVTKIEAHWYGFRVWLSRSVLQGIGAGVAIGGVWVPEPIVSKILATLGIVTSLAPGGVVFNWTPVIIPGFAPAGATWGVEWQ